MRKKTNYKSDKKIFKKTRNKVKSINISPTVMRGGIRL